MSYEDAAAWVHRRPSGGWTVSSLRRTHGSSARWTCIASWMGRE